MQVMEEGEEALCETFAVLAGDSIDGLLELQKSLRTTPAVRLDTPAVVLVGSPNVGKSSIVRAISSATPEVNNYPFVSVKCYSFTIFIAHSLFSKIVTLNFRQREG